MEKKFIGWRVVVATGLLYALLGNFGLAAAQLAIPAMAVDPTVAMNRSMIGLGFTVFILMQGLPGPLIGKVIAQYGARKAFIASSVLIVATGVLMGLFAGAGTVAYVVLFGVLLSFSCTLGGQIATQYVDEAGVPGMDLSVNPNGSLLAIEGITSPDGRVFGKMGHSERYSNGTFKNVPGEKDQPLFAAGVEYFAA